MNREEFIRQLESLLKDISVSEREEALAFYNGYFDEAGEENESKVIQELGSPGKVAAIIKADLSESAEDYAEYTEHGYEDSRVRDEGNMPEVYSKEQSQNQGGANHARTGYQAPKKKNNIGNLILIGIILLCASPLILGAAGAVLGVVFGIIGCVIGGIAALAAGILAAVLCGIVFLVVGVTQLFTSPGLGLLEIAGGLFAIAVGAILVLLFIVIVFQFIPWFVKKIAAICQNLSRKGTTKGGAAI